VADFLKEPVLEALRGAGRPLKAKELARKLDVPTGDYRDFKSFLRGLQAAGELYQVKHGRYAPPDRINLVVGHLTVIRSGAAFLAPEKSGEDVYVPAEELGNAYHGDKVVVRVESRRGRPEGRVVRVLERARSDFVGTVQRTEHFAMVRPDDRKFTKDVFVPLSEAGEARNGEKVVVEILDWGTATSGPVGRVTDVLGMPGDPGLDVLVIIKHNGLPTAFPPEIEAAASRLPDEVPAEEISRRLDLRKTAIVTIDPVSAKDFDDALSLEGTGDGNLELGVHIADVSHYVRFGDALDQEARMRGTSVYLVDRVLPMLPEKLSNNLCSLNPDVDRLAMSVIARLSPRGKLLDYRIEDTVIRSKRRLTYEQVQGYFDGDPGLRKELTPVAGLLDRLRKMAGVLNGKRMKRGALDFDLPESRVELDAEGYPVDIRKVVRLESHRLVEEFMLLANEIVARHLLRSKMPAMYRVHEEPAEQKLEELQEMIGKFGLSLYTDSKGKVPPKELQRILKSVEDRPEELILNTLVLRSLARARYDVTPLGHYGLALKDYTHFTSPIRRYPDLVVHRTLRVLSGKQERPIREKARYAEWLDDTAVLASDRERIAESAERDSVELKKIQFMERHLGDEFAGVITGVEAFGFFVELERYFVSGLVHVNNLGDDYYEYWEDDFALVGSNTGRRFTLGDRVDVQVLAVNKELRQIDFLLVGEEEPAEETESRRRRKARSEFEGKTRPKRPRSRRDEMESRKQGGRKRAGRKAEHARAERGAGGKTGSRSAPKAEPRKGGGSPGGSASKPKQGSGRRGTKRKRRR
jgi:ribonuclease R